MPLVAFLMKPQPGAPTLLEVVRNPEGDDRTDAGEGLVHQPQQGTVSKAYKFARIDRLQ
jgi:hypothetical protein